MKGDIAALRRALDEIDGDLVRLFERRMEVSRMVADYKRENGLPILDAGREAQVLDTRVHLLADKGLEAPLRALFMEIMRLSRLEQEKVFGRGETP